MVIISHKEIAVFIQERNPPMKAFLLAVAVSPVMLWGADQIFEAESGELAPKFTRVDAMTGASGGKALTLLSDRGRVDKPAEVPPATRIRFTVPRNGTYQITLRAKTDNDGSDSAYYAIDAAKPQMIGFGKHGQWKDLALPAVKLNSGEHTLSIHTREPGFHLDTVTVAGGTAYRPADLTRYPAPPLTPPAGHPRLLARSADLPTIRKNLNSSENRPIYELVQKLAAMPIDAKLTEKNARSRYGLYNESVLKAIEARAFLYLIENNEKAGREAVQAMSDFLRTVQFKPDFQDVTRQMGYVIYVSALVYDWCYPLMNATQRTEFIERSEEIASTMEIGFPPFRQGNITGHAGEAQLLRDLLAIGIAAYDENPNMYRVAAGRFFAEMVAPRNFFYVSGRHHQGNAYGPYRYMWEVFAGWLFRRMNQAEVFRPEIGKMVNIWLYGRLPDGSLFIDGDNFLRQGSYMRFPQAVFLLMNFTRDPLAKEEFIRQDGYRGYAMNDPVTFLLLNDPAIPVGKTAELPLTHYFPHPLGSMIARSGWGFGRAADPVVVEMKGAGYQYNNHHHLDAGSFQIYHRGLLAADLGQYGPYGTEYDWGFNKQSISHNLLLVYDPAEKRPAFNDGGQHHPNNRYEPDTQKTLETKGYYVGDTTAHAFGPDTRLPLFSYLKCDLSRAYGTRVRDYQRSFVYWNLNRPDVPGALVVFDHVVAADPKFRKSWILNTYEKPEVTPQGFRAELTQQGYNGRLEVHSLLPEAANRTISTEPALTVRDKTFTPPFPLDLSGQGFRTEISPKQPAAEDLFLQVIPVGTAGKAMPLPVSLLRNDAIVGAVLGDKITTFARDGKLLRRTFSLEVPQNRMQILLTDLAAGSWEVRTPDGSQYRAEVKTADHTLFFVAPQAGKYTLTPGENRHAPLPDARSLRAKPASGADGVTVDGRKLSLRQQPKKFAELLFVPAVDVLRALQITPLRQTAKELEFNAPTGKITFRAGDARAWLDSMQVDLPRAPRLENGEWFVPADIFGRLLGYEVQVENAANGAQFRTRKAQAAGIPILAAYSPAISDSPIDLMLDGDPVSYWAGEKNEGRFTVFLGRPRTVSAAEIIWSKGEQRRYRFELQASPDGREFKTVYRGESTPGAAPQEYRFTPVKAAFVRFIGMGNNQNDWNSVAEFRLK